MREPLLRRAVFVALLWAAVGLVDSVKLEAAYCSECAPLWSQCQNACPWEPMSAREECLDDCQEEFWQCTQTCDDPPWQCTAGDCYGWGDEACIMSCGWMGPGYCSPNTFKCCCPEP